MHMYKNCKYVVKEIYEKAICKMKKKGLAWQKGS